MFVLTWQNLIIWSVVITVALLVLGGVWKMMKKFIKFWLMVVCLLVVIKLMMDAGWLA